MKVYVHREADPTVGWRTACFQVCAHDERRWGLAVCLGWPLSAAFAGLWFNTPAGKHRELKIGHV